jgi:hypothetical protein
MRGALAIWRVALLVSAVVTVLVVAEIGLRIVQPIPSDEFLPLPCNYASLDELSAGDTYSRSLARERRAAHELRVVSPSPAHTERGRG